MTAWCRACREVPFMQDVEHWGVLTIGTGLGNARFTNRRNGKDAKKDDKKDKDERKRRRARRVRIEA